MVIVGPVQRQTCGGNGDIRLFTLAVLLRVGGRGIVILIVRLGNIGRRSLLLLAAGRGIVFDTGWGSVVASTAGGKRERHHKHQQKCK